MAKKYKKFEKSEKSPLNNDYFVMEETTLPLSDYILTNWTEQSEYSGFEINHDNFEDVLLKINVNELKNTWFCGVCYESFAFFACIVFVEYNTIFYLIGKI